MTPQELKNSILQLAIQGKLVEQRPEEGTAEELYKQIQTEKQVLIKAGKIKKEKPLPEITEDEIPFEIPDGWKWVRIASIVTLNPKNELPDELDTAFIPMPCVSDGYRNEHTYEIQKWGSIKKGFTHFANRDIGIAKITPCFQNRKSVIFKDLPNGYGAGTTELSIVRVIGDTLSREFLLWFFKSEYFISNGKKSFTGTAGQQRIHKDYLSTCVLPLPPLAEQKRIVAKIEELLPLIERYEKAWSRLEDFNKRFPVDMQKSILQMAIQGKLVEQRPEEGTGEELYRRIQTEKQALIKAGKIKKEKPLPEITEDEIPFEIPESWKWVRIGNIFNIGTGMTPLKSDSCFYLNGTVPWVNSSLTSKRYIERTDTYITEYALKNTSLTIYPVHTIVVAMYGQGKTRGQTSELLIPATINQACAALDNILYFQEMVDYVYYYFQYNYDVLRKKAEGTSQPNLNLQKIKETYIPLPPLAEQKRIVARLEELLPLCERLK